MPNTRIRDKWDPIIRQAKADHPEWTIRHMYNEFKGKFERGEEPDFPSIPTIARSLSDPYDKGAYNRFHWPEAMKNGALPWESSAACLELLALMDAVGMGRPTIRLARWYWRLTQAAPNMRRLRLSMALTLSSYDSAGLDIPPGVEWGLAYNNLPGSDEDRKKAYEKARTREKDPVPDPALPIQVAGSDGSDAWAFFKAWAAAGYGKITQKNGGN